MSSSKRKARDDDGEVNGDATSGNDQELVQDPTIETPSGQKQGVVQVSTTRPQAVPVAEGCSHSPVKASIISDSESPSSQTPSTWCRVVDAFFDGPSPTEPRRLDKSSITYLSENFPMAIVLDHFQDSREFRLHHRVPSPGLAPTKRLSHVADEDSSYLESKGVFERPPEQITEAFLSVFVDIVYPYYPIVIRKDFIAIWKSGETPWLLFHAVCSVAATYSPLHVIHAAGFRDREEARNFYHRKAKWAYDLGLEKSRIVVLQSTILLTYRLGEPDTSDNYYSWLSIAVTAAELLGIHRSTASLAMAAKDKALLKRLWWVLVVRDVFAAVCWGIPNRIDLTQCDTEAVNKDDFAYDCEPRDGEMLQLMASVVEYQVQMCQYSLLLGEIVRRRVMLNQPSTDAFLERMKLGRRLERLRSSLNLCSSNRARSPCVITRRLASALSIFYEHLRIVLHLRKSTLQDTSNQIEPRLISIEGSFQDPGSYARSVLVSASHNITSIASSLTTQELICHLPHECLVGIFSAEVALIGQLMTSDHTASWIAARAQISVCQLVMHSVKGFWESAISVSKMFDQVLARCPLPSCKDVNLENNDVRQSLGNPSPVPNNIVRSKYTSTYPTTGGIQPPWDTTPLIVGRMGPRGNLSEPTNDGTSWKQDLPLDAPPCGQSTEDIFDFSSDEPFQENWFAHDFISQVLEYDGFELDWLPNLT